MSRGGELKQWQRDGRWWSFSSTRRPIPGATFAQNRQFGVALWAEPDRNIGGARNGSHAFSCSLMPSDENTTQRLNETGLQGPVLFRLLIGMVASANNLRSHADDCSWFQTDGARRMSAHIRRAPAPCP
jgi:hypothetical protein